jgi:hypothetical protein
MTDDARVERIDALYEEMEDKYSFVKSFTDETIEVADARAKEKNDVEYGRLIYGVKNE